MVNLNYTTLPQHLREGMQRYLEDRIRPGGFLVAVLENDLMGAVRRADQDSLAFLDRIMMDFMIDVPPVAWGSPQKVERWLARTDPLSKGVAAAIAEPDPAKAAEILNKAAEEGSL
jgi:hypothetical protein